MPSVSASRPPPPNRLDKATFWVLSANLIVLTATLIAVSIYTCQSSRQMTQLVMQNRPVVTANRITPCMQRINNWPQAVDVVVVDYGKTVALNVVAPGELISAPSNDSAPVDSRCAANKSPPTNMYRTTLAQVGALTNGQPSYYPTTWNIERVDSLNHMEGRTLYAVGCIYYKGLDGSSYYSDVCTQWTGKIFDVCKDRQRNYVK